MPVRLTLMRSPVAVDDALKFVGHKDRRVDLKRDAPGKTCAAYIVLAEYGCGGVYGLGIYGLLCFRLKTTCQGQDKKCHQSGQGRY